MGNGVSSSTSSSPALSVATMGINEREDEAHPHQHDRTIIDNGTQKKRGRHIRKKNTTESIVTRSKVYFGSIRRSRLSSQVAPMSSSSFRKLSDVCVTEPMCGRLQPIRMRVISG